MILEFSLRNYRSFRDEHTLSLLAEPDKEHEATHTASIPGTDGERVLRSVAIYGPNASGKTNLLRGLNAMREIVVYSASKGQRGDAIAPIQPFRLTEAGRTSPTAFEVAFVLDGIEHLYGFEATRERVHSEWLYSYPKGRRRRWFERTYDAEADTEDYQFGESMEGQKKQIATATRSNALYLSTAAQLNNESIAPVFDWFRERLQFLHGREVDHATTLSLCEDEGARELITTLLKSADVGIQEMFIEEREIDFSDLPSHFVDFLDESGARSQFEQQLTQAVRFQHSGTQGDVGRLDLDEESHGTQQFFALAGPLLATLASGGTLLVDELDASLHSRLVEEIISLFHSPETNPNNAQIFFNLHDTTPFDRDVLRRDQIWLTEKDNEGASELVALLEYSPRKEEALEKGYREGRYGGVPVPRIVQKAQLLTDA